MIDQEQPVRQRTLSREPVADTSPAPRPPRQTHVGTYVRLEPLDPAFHGPALWPLASDPADDPSWEFLAYGPWSFEDDYLARLAAWQQSEDPLFFAIIDQKTGAAVGTGSLMRITPEARSIEIGHLWYSTALRRTPAATEAIYLLLRHAFDLGYRRVEWKCDAANSPSRRAARRLGFTYEGTFHRHLIVKGLNRDTAWYSILAEEWPGIRAGFEEWLAQGNFDASGKQLKPIATIPPTLSS